MDNKQGLKSKMNRKVDRPLGWGIMGAILIIVFTLGVVCACAAADNKDGITAMIVIGSIALAVLVLGVVVHYVRKPREDAAVEPVEEKEVQPAKQTYMVCGQAYTADQMAAKLEALLKAESTSQEEAAPAEEPAFQEEVAETPVANQEEEIEVAPQEAATQEAQAEVPADEQLGEESTAELAADEADAEPIVEAEQEEEAQPVEAQPEPEQPAISVEAAHDSMSNEEALAKVERGSRAPINGPMCTVNVGVLSATFAAGETVTLDALHAKGLVPRKETGYIVLAAGSINKPLTVIANDFSADAVKMILLAGGKAIGC